METWTQWYNRVAKTQRRPSWIMPPFEEKPAHTADIVGEWVRGRLRAEAARRERFLESALGPLARVKRLRLFARVPFGCALAWHDWRLYEQNVGIGLAWPYWLECSRCHVVNHPRDPASTPKESTEGAVGSGPSGGSEPVKPESPAGGVLRTGHSIP